MNRGTLLGLLIASAALVTLSMLFSISESAFLSMNKLRLRILKKEKNVRALRVARLLENKELLINTLLLANELVNILLSSIVTAVSMKLFGSKGVGYATFAVTLILLVFGEITPKAISTRKPDGIAYSLSLFVYTVVHILRPFVWFFTGISRLILKLRRISIEKPEQTYSEEDIKSFIEAGEEIGVLENGEKNIMNSVFKFTDITAVEIMIPRTSMVRLSSKASYADVILKAQQTRFSQFPVYGKNIDDIVGIIYLKDLLKTTPEKFEMTEVMRPPLFIPGTRKITSVVQVMQENHQNVAIIIDEYSGTDGLITQSDIHREIFGTAGNKTPWQKESNLQEFKNKDTFVVDGSTLLVDLKIYFGINLESNINDTLGGWITEKLDRIAVVGDSVEHDGEVFSVVKTGLRRITQVQVVRRKSREGADD